jgi:hypothetical protein
LDGFHSQSVSTLESAGAQEPQKMLPSKREVLIFTY